MVSSKNVSEVQFVIRFRKERRAPSRGADIWRAKILLVPRKTSGQPEIEWSHRWVRSIDEVPEAIRSLLADAGIAFTDDGNPGKSPTQYH